MSTHDTTRPRARRGFRRLAIVAFVTLIPVALHSLWDYIEIRRLVREIEAVIARGEPVTEHQAGLGYRKQSPEEDLAGRYYLSAAHVGYPVMAADREAIRALSRHVLGHAPRDFDLAAVKERLRRQTAEGQTALGLADRAAALPFNGFSAGMSYSYLTSELLELRGLQSVRTASLSLAGSADAAVDAAITALGSRAIVPSMIDWAARPEYDPAVVLSFANASGAALARYQQALESLDRPDLVEQAVVRDRAMFIDRMFRVFYNGDASAPQRYGTIYYRGEQGGLARAVWRPWLTRRFVETLRGWNELVEASRLPWPEKSGRMATIYARFNRPVRPRPPFSSEQLTPRRAWWFPDTESLFSTTLIPRTFERLVIDRASVTAIAVQRFMLEQGRIPASLDELRGKYLRDVPADPYTGEPYRLKVEPGSFTVYSAGPDGNDDGGDLLSQLRQRDERGWGLAQLRGRDVGIRVITQQEVR